MFDLIARKRFPHRYKAFPLIAMTGRRNDLVSSPNHHDNLSNEISAHWPFCFFLTFALIFIATIDFIANFALVLYSDSYERRT